MLVFSFVVELMNVVDKLCFVFLINCGKINEILGDLLK